MNLIHYTNSLESAKSIIASKELWLGRSGEAPKDNDEINHYLKIFNDFHTIETFNNYIVKSEKKRTEIEILGGLYNELIHREKKERLGDVLAKILKEQTHIICFTEEDDISDYHEQTYGEIRFEFKKNPLKHIEGFELVQQKIIYLDTTEYNKYKVELDDFFKNLSDRYLTKLNLNVKRDELKAIFEDNYKNGNIPEINMIDLKDLFYEHIDIEIQKKHRYNIESIVTSLNTESFKNNIIYINNEVNDIRESLILKRCSPFYASMFKIMGTFRHVDTMITHLINIGACFIKDKEFENDKETRIIAIPNKKYTYNERYLKVPYDPEQLIKISVSEKIQSTEREKYIREIKEELEKNNIKGVQVE